MASNKGRYFECRVYAASPGEKSGVMQHKLEYRTGTPENPGGSRWAWIPASMAVQTADAIYKHYKLPVPARAAAPSQNGTAKHAAAAAVVAADDSDDSLI